MNSFYELMERLGAPGKEETDANKAMIEQMIDQLRKQKESRVFSFFDASNIVIIDGQFRLEDDGA